MVLRYLELKNFLSHEYEELSFPDAGMFLLAGESGFGKSSLIVDAVAYALYGPAATRARKQADLLHENHPGQAMSVRAMFDFSDTDRITIERGFDSKGASFAKLYEPDTEDESASILLAEGAQPVARLLSRRLGGMTWQQFYAAFAARQSEIADLTSRNPGDRKNLIHRMLGMRELEKANELISARLRRAKAEEDQLQRSVGSFDLQAARQSLADAVQRIDEAEARVSEAETELKEQTTVVEKLQNEIQPLEKAVLATAELESLQARLQAAQTQLAQKQDLFRRHSAAEKVITDEVSLREKHLQTSKQRDSLRDIYSRSREAEQKEEQLKELDTKEKQFREQLSGDLITAEEARARAQVLKSQIKIEEETIAEREADLQKLEESGECYVCQRPFASEHDHKDVVDQLKSAVAEMRTQLKSHHQELKDNDARLPLLEQSEENSKKSELLQTRLQELKNEGQLRTDLEALLEEGRRAKESVEELAKQLAVIDAARAELDPTAEEAQNKAELTVKEAEQQLSQAQSVAADPEQLRRHQQLSEESEAANALITAVRARIPELQNAQQAAVREHGGIERELQGRQKELADLETLRNKVLVSEKVSTYLRAYQRKLAGEIRPALEEIGSEMLNRISGGRHVAMHINDDYEISVETANGATLRAAMLSGGEEIRTNICLRLALTRLVSQRTGVPVGFLVFDEPLPAQDPGHVERILELLQSLRPFYQQQFIISHVGDLRSADEMDYILEFERADGQKRVQLVNA